jgi:hypothetical protein
VRPESLGLWDHAHLVRLSRPAGRSERPRWRSRWWGTRWRPRVRWACLGREDHRTEPPPKLAREARVMTLGPVVKRLYEAACQVSVTVAGSPALRGPTSSERAAPQPARGARERHAESRRPSRTRLRSTPGGRRDDRTGTSAPALAVMYAMTLLKRAGVEYF